MQTKAAIIGGGEIGQAVKKLCLPEKVLGIFDHDRNLTTLPSPEAMAEADIVFVCVPSQFIRLAISENLAHFKPDALVVALTKGLEKESNELVPEIMSEVLQSQKYALLSGPMIAEEIHSGKPAAAFLAAESRNVFDTVASVLDKDKITLQYTDEITAIALLASLKNIYAIGLGILSALESGTNAQAYFVVQALHEMERILTSENVSARLLYELPGLGDFLATGSSHGSKNRSAGEAIALNHQRLISEGTHALEALYTRLGEQASTLPLFSALYEIIVEKAAPQTLADKLFHA